jgi:hypothetical protein
MDFFLIHHHNFRNQRNRNNLIKNELHCLKSKNLFFCSSKKKSRISIDSSASVDETAATRRDRPVRARTRDEIYGLYCTFGEKKHPGEDFITKIMNILRASTEGLLTHSEVDKQQRS